MDTLVVAVVVAGMAALVVLELQALVGSGYTYTKENSTNYPEGCLLNSSYYLKNAETINGSQTFPAANGINIETGHIGNGHAKITQLD